MEDLSKYDFEHEGVKYKAVLSDGFCDGCCFFLSFGRCSRPARPGSFFFANLPVFL
jgi:hypothetical protein